MEIKTAQDIALIFPPHRLKEHRYSLGLLYISGYLRDHGFDNIIVENKVLGGKNYQYQGKDQAQADIIAKVIELKPKVIAFTASTIEINDVVEMNRQIRQQTGEISIIGGPHVTAVPKEVLQNGFDVAVMGEGEQTALELVQELQKLNPDFSQIKGIAYKNSDGQVVVNPPRELIDIAELSLPAYDKVYMEKYLRVCDEVLRGVPVRAAIVMASRGCPYTCTFCACNKVFGRKVRYRSFENIKKEIDLLKNEYNAEAIWFADDTMTVSYDHVEKICELMRQEKMFWGAQSRVDLTDEKIVSLMKKSGCLQLDFGVESGNQRVLDEIINKRINLDQVQKAFALCRKYGIRTHAAFMIGLPTESRQEMIDTFEFAQKIKPSWYAFGIFTPLPGTFLYDHYYQPGEITLADYKNVSFHKPTEKFNRSQVKDLEELFSVWRKKLFEGVKRRNLSHPFIYFKLFFVLPNKAERADYLFFKLRRLIKYFLNKFGFKFSLASRI
ncbi:MAG: radical SAM protein [Candidatus Buchananbacteria bacterium]